MGDNWQAQDVRAMSLAERFEDVVPDRSVFQNLARVSEGTNRL
jgi:hypothetical protein